jgi:hypothetical protein
VIHDHDESCSHHDPTQSEEEEPDEEDTPDSSDERSLQSMSTFKTNDRMLLGITAL